jgi:predicted DNA-binding antitoxin AbrB/MazE fold protein
MRERGALMTITVEATYEDGVLKPEAPLNLKENSNVTLTIEAASETTADDDDPTGWKTAESFVGLIKDAPEGEPIAREHDKHLYK